MACNAWVFSCVPLCFQYVPPCATPCVPLYVLLLAANQCFRQCVPGCFALSCVPCALAVGLPLRFFVNYTAHFQWFPSCISCVVPALFFVLLCRSSSCFVAWLPPMFLLYSVCVLVPFLIRYVIFSQCVRSYILCLLSCLFWTSQEHYFYRHQSRADLHKTKTFKLLKTFFLNVSLKRLSEAIRDEIMKKNNIKCQHFLAQWNATVQGRVYDSLVLDLYHSSLHSFSSGCVLRIYLHFTVFHFTAFKYLSWINHSHSLVWISFHYVHRLCGLVWEKKAMNMKVIQPVTSQYMSIKQQASKVHAPSTNKAQTKLDIEYVTRF